MINNTRWALVVEDEEDLREIIVETLIKFGFKVISCGKLSEAKIKVKNQKFEVLFLDMHLGAESGEEIIEMVREDVRGYNYISPIIVISGFLDPELIQRIGKTVNDILVKPFDMKTFFDRTNAVLSAPQQSLNDRRSKKS